jgi:homocysteine S-methyltransferase
LYDKGVYINRSYDELNLTAPDLVREVHEEYVNAGADIIETNSFGATRHKLQPYGLRKQASRDKHRRGTHRTRGGRRQGICCRSDRPLGLRMEPSARHRLMKPRNVQGTGRGLTRGRVDLFILETFSELEAIEQAIRAVREVSDLPVIAQMTIQADVKTTFGTSPEVLHKKLDELDVDVIG